MAKNTDSFRNQGNNFRTFTIEDKYLVGRKLGAGNFGELRLAKELSSGKLLAVKLELANSNNRQLYLENRYYRNFNKKKRDGIPILHYYGLVDRYYALVIDLLGPNLEELFEMCGKKFSIKTTSQIAIQTINIIKTIHSHNIIYRDIKPENFLVSRDTEKLGKVYIVDFGLSKEYIDPSTNKHIPYREHKSLTGTARYMSINTHLGKEQSRRDDLESLGHMYFYFLRGNLPWQGLKAESVKERYQKIGEVKRATPVEILCENHPIEFAKYLRYSRQLDFYQTPNYEAMTELFIKLLDSLNVVRDNVMDWATLNKTCIKQFSDTDFNLPVEENNKYSESQRGIVQKTKRITSERKGLCLNCCKNPEE